MADKVIIAIEQTESGYLLTFPEIENYQIQDSSLDQLLEKLKIAITSSMQKPTTGESILSMIADFTSDMTEDEVNQLPTDAAEQHDRYLYGTHKKLA